MKDDKRCSRFRRIWFSLIIMILFIFIVSPPGLAHKVILFAYAQGNRIFTESYFSDGKRCQNSTIEVFDQDGKKLLEGTTNKNGEFSFKIPEKTDLRIVLSASMGHRAEYTIPANELPDIARHRETAPEMAQADLKQIQSLIEEALDEKLRPIMKEIKKSQEHKISATEVVGGIGYIFGLMGVIIYFIGRRNRKD